MPSDTAPHPDPAAAEPHPAPPRNVATGEVDYTPHPETHPVDVPAHRLAIKQAITNLYCGSASEEDMSVYAEQAIYDDPFSYCDTRHKIAGQWYGIPKLFSKSETLATELVSCTDDELVWKQRQRYTFKGGIAAKTADSLISLRFEKPAGGNPEDEKVVYHKDMWNEKDYSHEGLGMMLKKLNGDQLIHITQPPESL